MRKNNNKKGFTLVEVIVVLVILAILAALMIPSMVKWIDRAQDKSVLVEARTALMAAQTVASENYAKNVKNAFDANSITAAQTLAGTGGAISAVTVSDGTVTALTYTTTGNKQVSYTKANGWGDVGNVTPPAAG